MTRANARALLQRNGFAVVDGSVPGGEDDVVIGQDPGASAEAEVGEIVSLRFSAATPTPTPTPTPVPAPAPPPVDTVQYSVWGSGTSASSVTYSIPNGAFSQSQVAGASIPWSVTLPITGRYNAYVVLAQAGDGDSISCAITINGKIVDQQTSTGPYTIVTCSHSSF
ncbi:membrane protein [Leifsonia sp. 98AMF]|nr:membrane protein [Leifsonia sp. 197AMF]SDI89629.1 membrane protein [Leifsonia sp. 466MF]SDJ90961.1 membrane protein [Leifsonia sp. 157MF]SDN93329.1 membrane protein [Leifsonia sp. 509MF]SEN12436.1 membrane protein [Leifsonia sp. 467MF]SFM02599.1 membrane protein [Leifsonia sp. 98AMF]